MSHLMSIKMREVDNGFILEIDGFVGNEESVLLSIEEVTKEIENYWERHSKAIEKRNEE